MITLRFFAAARAATGRDSINLESVEQTPTIETALATVADLVGVTGDGDGSDLDRVFSRCSFLVDGLATTDRTARLTDGSTVDVLPPFAGG